jgi:hypothetical protein
MEPKRTTINKDGLVVDPDSGEVIRPLVVGFDIPILAPKRRRSL